VHDISCCPGNHSPYTICHCDDVTHNLVANHSVCLLLWLQGVDAESDPEGFVARKLQQAELLPDPNSGYARAVRIIFSNIFDFFRANGEASCCCCWHQTPDMHSNNNSFSSCIPTSLACFNLCTCPPTPGMQSRRCPNQPPAAYTLC